MHWVDLGVVVGLSLILDDDAGWVVDRGDVEVECFVDEVMKRFVDDVVVWVLDREVAEVECFVGEDVGSLGEEE